MYVKFKTHNDARYSYFLLRNSLKLLFGLIYIKNKKREKFAVLYTETKASAGTKNIKE